MESYYLEIFTGVSHDIYCLEEGDPPVLLANPCFSIAPADRPCGENDILLCLQKDSILLEQGETENTPGFPSGKQVLPWLDTLEFPTKPSFLFTVEGIAFFGLDVPETSVPKDSQGLSFYPISIFRTLGSRRDSFALLTAYHLLVWARCHRFCGCCGHSLAPSTTERALACTHCGQVIYPTISPAISVAITDGDRLLMACNARGRFTHFSLVAGYVEAGESLEQTVAREVQEEVGLRVKNLRYVGSQPWGLSQTLMLGFHAELDGSDRITLQESELTEAKWFHRSEITANPGPLSLSFAMIEMFRTGTLP